MMEVPDDYEDDYFEVFGYSDCPQCQRHYDEIDYDLQLCSKCGWDADKNEYDLKYKREPTNDDFMAGDADIITGRWY